MPTVNDETLTLHSPPGDVNTVHEYIERIWAARPDLDPVDRVSFETALIELATNVIQHADDGNGVQAVVSITVTEHHIRGCISDMSMAADVNLAMREMPDEYEESGRGIAIIQRLVDVLHYERRDDENLWVVEKRRAHA